MTRYARATHPLSFNSRPSWEYDDVAERVRGLAATCLDDAERAVAEGLCREREKAWRARWKNALTRSSRIPCVHALVGRRCGVHDGYGPCFPSDHTTLWSLGRRPFAYVTQPYGWSTEELTQALAFCQERHLDIEIDADRGWYFPGRALLIVVRRQSWRDEWNAWKQANERPQNPQNSAEKSQ